VNASRARIVGVAVACLLLVLPAGSSLATGGLLDTSFGSGGTVLLANTSANRMSVAPDGKIVFASSDGSAFTAIRLNPNGTLDTTFDGDGRVSVDVTAGFDQGLAVAFAPGGKIVIAGHAGGDFGVIRLNDDGSLDPSFDGDGIFTQPRPAPNRLELASEVKVDGLGRIVVGGESQAGLNGTSDFMLLRLTPAGVLDSTFDGDGIVRTDFALSNDGAFDIELNADGTIVAAGRAYTGTWDAAFARYLDDGTLDPSFSGDGLLAFDLGGNEEVSRIAIASGRGIAFALPFGTDFTTFRLKSDGTLDPAYSGDGRSDPIDFGGADDVSDVAVDAQGRVVVVGQSDAAGAVDWAVGRYDADGTVDTDFGTAGRLPPAFDEGAAVNVALQPDGKILVSGPAASGATAGLGVARYLGDATTNAAPSASFTVTPSSGTTATSFAFDGRGSSDPDSDPLTYAWAFGDGGTATGSTATHGYAAPGTFTATLTVDDGQGNTASTTRSVPVTAPAAAPAPSPTPSPTPSPSPSPAPSPAPAPSGDSPQPENRPPVAPGPGRFGLTVRKIGRGGGVVTATPGPLRCGSVCFASYAQGETVVLQAVPAQGFAFRGWSDACSGLGSTCTITVRGAQSVTARFEPRRPTDPFTLYVDLRDGGAVATWEWGIDGAPIDCGKVCANQFRHDSFVRLVAVPRSGFDFAGWTGDCAGQGAWCRLQLSAPRATAPRFVPRPAVLSVTKTGDGTVATWGWGLDGRPIDCGSVCTKQFQEGMEVRIVALPAPGFDFAGWTGACAGQGSWCSLTLSGPRATHANFAINSGASG
jgi:uncharacterized delta-60 repeat protein